MKILAIMGSPHKGSSYSAVKIIEDELKKEGAEVEYLFLKDVKLNTCMGCFQCLQKGEDKCPHKDDRDKIIDRMLAADGVIFSSPVYVMNVTGLFKNFIDRTAFICHRPAFFSQHALCVANTGAIGTGRVVNYMAEWAGIIGFRTAVKVGVRTNPTDLKEIQAAAEKELRKGARRLVRNIQRNPSPSLMSLAQFRVQRAVFNNPEVAVDLIADHEYYKKTAGMRYYVDVKIPLWKRSFSWLAERAFLIFIK